MKKQNGITLIALVVTIIILIILAGISMNFILRENGVIEKAKQASAEYNKQAAIEKLELKIANIQASSYQNNGELLTLQYLVDVLSKDGEIEYIALKSQRIASIDKVQIGDSKSFFTKLKAYPYEFEVNNSFKIASIDGIKTEKDEEILVGLNIGDTVTYSPSGTYNWQVEYYSTNDEYKETELEDVMLDSSSTGEFNITKWRIFNIDEKNKKVELISDKPTNGTVFLLGWQSYNNGVTLLNEACENLYGNASKGITARNINTEDIENKMTETALAEVYSYTDAAQYGKQTTAYTGDNANYPTIYASENKSVIDGEEITSGGLEKSYSTTLIGRTTNNDTEGMLTASESIRPYQTHWYKNNTFLQTAFKGDGTNTDNVNYSLIIPDGTNTNYWVASRVISLMDDYCLFGIKIVYTGWIGMYNSRNSMNQSTVGHELALRPIVTLDYDMITGSDELGWSVSE